MEEIETQVTINQASGNKCRRCSQWSIDVGRIWKWPDLCHRCADEMDGLDEAFKLRDETGDIDPLYQYMPAFTELTTHAEFYEKFQKPFEDHPIRKFKTRWPGPSGEVWPTKEEATWIEYK